MHWQERENRARALVNSGFSWPEAWAAVDYGIAAAESNGTMGHWPTQDQQEEIMAQELYFLRCESLNKTSRDGTPVPRRYVLAFRLAPLFAQISNIAPGATLSISGRTINQADIDFIVSCEGREITVVDEFGDVWADWDKYTTERMPQAMALDAGAEFPDMAEAPPQKSRVRRVTLDIDDER